MVSLQSSQFIRALEMQQQQQQQPPPPPPSFQLTLSRNFDFALREAIASRRCNCSYTAFQIIVELQRQSRIYFESILCVATRIFDQWTEIMGCKYCRKTPSSLVVLSTAAERLLTMYTAACELYGLTGSKEEGTGTTDEVLNAHPPESHPQATGMNAGQTTTERTVCVHSRVKLEGVTLEGEEAKLLVRVLLGRNLVKLGTLLGDQDGLVSCVSDAMNQNSVLGACEASIADTMEKLIILAGLIRT